MSGGKVLQLGRWLPVAEAAEALGIKPATVRQWATRGKIQRRSEGGRVLYRVGATAPERDSGCDTSGGCDTPACDSVTAGRDGVTAPVTPPDRLDGAAVALAELAASHADLRARLAAVELERDQAEAAAADARAELGAALEDAEDLADVLERVWSALEQTSAIAMQWRELLLAHGFTV